MTLSIVLIIFLLIMTITAGFLGKELLKKFKMYEKFSRKDGYLQKSRYQWEGEKKGKMNNFIIEAENPFSLLIGFELIIPIIQYNGVDWFGYKEAKRINDKKFRIVVSTYTGKNPTEFIFYLSSEKRQDKIRIEMQKEMKSDLVCPPHWFQKL